MRLNRSGKLYFPAHKLQNNVAGNFVYIVACNAVATQRSREGTYITAGKHVNDIRAIAR
jgi:hypothetical protein